MMKDNFLIVAGGSIEKSLLKKYIDLCRYDFIIGVDKGLEALDKLGIRADLAIGDFDSASLSVGEKFKKKENTIVLNPKKDYTDTHMALLSAIERGAGQIDFMGATGTRIDHMLGNISLLKICLMNGIRARLIDKNNIITMTDDEIFIKKSEEQFKYVSLIPYSDKVTGINTEGFLYELHDATLVKEETIGISNELREEEGHISIGNGYLLVLMTKD